MKVRQMQTDRQNSYKKTFKDDGIKWRQTDRQTDRERERTEGEVTRNISLCLRGNDTVLRIPGYIIRREEVSGDKRVVIHYSAALG